MSRGLSRAGCDSLHYNVFKDDQSFVVIWADVEMNIGERLDELMNEDWVTITGLDAIVVATATKVEFDDQCSKHCPAGHTREYHPFYYKIRAE
jgi:hypothetical protein